MMKWEDYVLKINKTRRRIKILKVAYFFFMSKMLVSFSKLRYLSPLQKVLVINNSLFPY